MEQLKEIAKESLTGVVKRILNDNDYVFAHSQDQGEAVITVLRYNNGAIVERMENRQQIPATSNPSGHTMLDDETEITDKDKTELNKALVSSLLDAMLNGRSGDLPSFFDGDNYINHNPKAYDGLSGFAKGMAERAKSGIITKYERVRMVLGEGNYVLAITEGTINDAPTAFFDIFRVENGKVAEHWDVVSQITSETFQ